MQPCHASRTLLPLSILALFLASPALGQVPGNCLPGTAQARLDVNNVQASVFNNGALFFGGTTTNGDGYLVPKGLQKSPIFSASLWVGGKVNGTLRVAAARYGGYTFWPGPLDAAARPVNPASCSEYDRIYRVSRADIDGYEQGSVASQDLRDWPGALGAPVLDGDGDPTNYNFAGGDRPDIVGDQGIWWVMNDVGNARTLFDSYPLGIEVRVLAYAFDRADALKDVTFYRYSIVNRNSVPIDSTYIGFFADPNLGNSGDDYIGYDADREMAYVYNSDNDDGTPAGYGIPPAVGFDFLQTPVLNGVPLGVTSFPIIHKNFVGPYDDPITTAQYFNRLKGLWSDGTSMVARGDGIGLAGSAPSTLFGYSGDPISGEGWSERFPGPGLSANPTGDRRLLLASGPFGLAPNETQQLTVGIVFAQGADHLDSIRELRKVSDLAQRAGDAGAPVRSEINPPPLCTADTQGSGQCLEAVTSGNGITLVWGYPPSDANYLGGFDESDWSLEGQGAVDSTHTFEGFNIYKMRSAYDYYGARELVATYDVANGVTRVVDFVYDQEVVGLVPFVVANGTDSGVQYHHALPGLINHADYSYGVSAYVYNAESSRKVIESAPTVIRMRPAGLTGGDRTQSQSGDTIVADRGKAIGESTISAIVVDPGSVTGDTYAVRYYHPITRVGSLVPSATTYELVNSTTGRVLLDGQAYYIARGEALPQGDNIAVFDGLSFSIQEPEAEFKSFLTVANAAGPLIPFTGGASSAAGYPVPRSPDAEQQVANARWLFSTGGRSTFSDFVSRATRDGDNNPNIFPHDFEMRWSGTSVAAKNGIFGQSGSDVPVPFELWDIGIGTPDNPADDVRLIPAILDNDNDGAYNLSAADSPIDAGADDPETDWIYWYKPVDTSPGSAGYLAYENGGTVDANQIGDEILARTTLVGWNLGAGPPYSPALPEPGTIFRITTAKPAQAGDVYTIATSGMERLAGSAEEAIASLDQIQVVPNPYLGESGYETGSGERVVRFTNVSERPATIRIFTVGGSLIATINKLEGATTVDWDLTNQYGFLAASGMYLVHIRVQGIGERVLKLGVIQRK